MNEEIEKERIKEFLDCLGNGKSIYEIESEEYWENEEGEK